MLQIKRSILVLAWLTVLCGLLYPLVVTGIAQSLFPSEANGSLIYKGETVIGSRLIGQSFTRPDYFSGRPSAINPPYDASNSGGSNLAPSNAKLILQVQARVADMRLKNSLADDVTVPADLVLASASGLDPHISPASASLQARRVGDHRRIPQAKIEDLIRQNTEQPLLGIWGKERVSVLELNLALDRMSAEN